MAFISTIPVLSSSASAVHGNSICPSRLSRKHYANSVVAVVKRPEVTTPETKRFNKVEENRIAKELAKESLELDYYPFAEQLNGRAAMIGFMIGLVTEAVSGKGILEQLHIIFSPLL